MKSVYCELVYQLEQDLNLEKNCLFKSGLSEKELKKQLINFCSDLLMENEDNQQIDQILNEDEFGEDCDWIAIKYLTKLHNLENQNQINADDAYLAFCQFNSLYDDYFFGVQEFLPNDVIEKIVHNNEFPFPEKFIEIFTCKVEKNQTEDIELGLE